ncbi:hypothetical protein T265_02214 [Opisthorchis viverrini]|uniref:Uncharacterized protein n=1 Tax=Opisthorchis viverrini TaxID=6198 RepID=A0A074ZWS6_OPIVI|nr:hypothetical protein T265_02214 [Opisthorchis viverrini]KER31571.1 hypothetical protein T265_02214 [Opisthorchis viverrini]
MKKGAAEKLEIRLDHSNKCATTYPTSQIIGERNCGSYSHCTTSMRFLQLIMMMTRMMKNQFL